MGFPSKWHFDGVPGPGPGRGEGGGFDRADARTAGGRAEGAPAVTFAPPSYGALRTTAVSALSCPAVGCSSRMTLRRVAGSGGRQLRLAPVVALPGAEKARAMVLAPG